jgi:hypothetical protein
VFVGRRGDPIVQSEFETLRQNKFPVADLHGEESMPISRAVRSMAVGWLVIASTGACSSRPVPFNDGLVVLEHDVNQVNPLPLSDQSGGKGDSAIITNIENAQCVANSLNPLVPVISGAFSLQLMGQLQTTGTGGGIIAGAPSIPLSFAIQVQKGQQITVPITFVALATLPDYYFGQLIANFNGLSDTIKEPISKRLLLRRDALQALIQPLLVKAPGDAFCRPVLDALKQGKAPPIRPFSPSFV